MPTIEFLTNGGSFGINNNVLVWVAEDVVLYPLLGYFIGNKLKVETYRKYLLPLWGVNILTIVASCYLTFLTVVKSGICDTNVCQTFFVRFVCINAIVVFLTAKAYFNNATNYNLIEKSIAILAKTSFGIYFIHNLIIVLLFKDRYYANGMLMAIVEVVLIMSVSHIITCVVLKIPILKKMF